MRGKRAVVLVTAAAVMLLSAAPASAGRPTAGCAPAFTLMTFEEIIEAWPPPPEVDAEAALSFYDRNDDRSLCVMQPTGSGTPAGPINVVDNVAAA